MSTKKYTFTISFDDFPLNTEIVSCFQRAIKEMSEIESEPSGQVGVGFVQDGIIVDMLNNEMDSELRDDDLSHDQKGE